MKILRILFVILFVAGFASADVGEKVWGTGRPEQVIYTNDFEGDTTSFSIAAYNAANCLLIQRDIIQLSQGCNSRLAKISWARDVLITKFSIIGVKDGVAGPSQSANDGCNFQLMTGQTGFVVMPGGELIAPTEDGVDIEDGDVISIIPNVVLPAGTGLAIAVHDGDFCKAGTLCVCDDAWNDSVIEILGIFQ